MPDLIVCVRCHQDPTLIADTVDAARYHTDPDTTVVMAAVDGFPKLADRLENGCHIPTYCSKRRNGWGAGLFTLLMESIFWAWERYGHCHFMTIDYDTLFINPGVDDYILGLIDSPEIGLIGKWIPDNARWAETYHRERGKIESIVGKVPDTYIPGEGCQGGCMTLTQALITALKNNHYFAFPRLLAKNWTTIADDHLISLVCRVLGLDIVHGGNVKLNCNWKAACDPRGLERKGCLVFHPIKIVTAFGNYNRNTDMEIRNYFREKRGRKPLK